MVVKKNTFDNYSRAIEQNGFSMGREHALSIIMDNVSENFIVSTTGKTSREVFELREKKGQAHDCDFLMVGSMGHTSSFALGLSYGTEKDIYCIDGDGSFLMHMGASAVVAQNLSENFKYIIINNGAHESVGGQPTVALDIDVKAILTAVGVKHVYEASNENQINQSMSKMRDKGGCALIINVKQGSRADLIRPTNTPRENKKLLMEKINK